MKTARLNPSRRAFLRGTLGKSDEDFHITSLVVHAIPAQLKSVLDAIEQLPGAELSGNNDHGKIVVILETKNEHLILESIDQINAIPGVITTSMVYHQVEEYERTD